MPRGVLFLSADPGLTPRATWPGPGARVRADHWRRKCRTPVGHPRVGQNPSFCDVDRSCVLCPALLLSPRRRAGGVEGVGRLTVPVGAHVEGLLRFGT